MNCLVSSLKSVPNSTTETIDYLKKKGRLELWSGILGIRSLERAANEQALNREAESAHVRQKVWGMKTNGADPMHDTYLGDVTHVHSQKGGGGGNLLKGLLGAGLLATGVGVPAGAWMIADALRSQPPAPAPVVQTPPPAVDTDTLYNLRLGRPEE